MPCVYACALMALISTRIIMLDRSTMHNDCSIIFSMLFSTLIVTDIYSGSIQVNNNRRNCTELAENKGLFSDMQIHKGPNLGYYLVTFT